MNKEQKIRNEERSAIGTGEAAVDFDLSAREAPDSVKMNEERSAVDFVTLTGRKKTLSEPVPMYRDLKNVPQMILTLSELVPKYRDRKNVPQTANREISTVFYIHLIRPTGN
jgi:hypothetical protein